MQIPYELLALRLIHVLGGIIWVGGAFVSMVWFAPAIMSAGPAAASIGATLQRRKMMQVMPIIALLTLLSGLRLLAITSGGFQAAYFRTATGTMFASGGLLAILAFVFGLLIARPRAMQGKLGATYVVNAMILLATAAMALARYVV